MRWLAGILLVSAGILKGLELYQHPTSALVDNHSRYLMPVLVGSELWLGIVAVTGCCWNRVRLLLMTLFAGFACYSMLLALQGATSCGCFGELAINPWWTFLLDAAVFSGLALECFTRRTDESGLGYPSSLSTRVCLAGTLLVSVAFTCALAWYVAPQEASIHKLFHTVGELVILTPETWVGQDFPLIEHIDLDVSQGKWVILMHRHDCPKCQEAIPRYERLAVLNPNDQVAIVAVPPHDDLHETHSNHCRVGRLSDDHEWFVETPVEIQLTDGFVVSASTGLPFLNDHSLVQNAEGIVPRRSSGRISQHSDKSKGTKL